MDRFKNSLLASILFATLWAAPVSAFPDNDGLHRLTTPIGGVAFEVVGQVTNFPPAGAGLPATSQQYGYLSLINGLGADQIFTTANPTMQNETTARFTFFTDAVTERVISNGRLRIVNRTGTTTIYLDETPDGDFGNRDTFRKTFTVMNLLTVTDAQTFQLGAEEYKLARRRDQFRQFYSGAPPAATPPSGVFAGYAVAIERARPDNH